jgi:HAD superfamily hydrolase (TIGR01662 family)
MSYYFQNEGYFSQSESLKEAVMNPNIEAIFLDVGNTLRIVIEDPEFMAQARKDLMALVGTTLPEAEFFDRLDARWKVYRKQSKESLLEASERDLWRKWMLPDQPAEKIAPLAGRLTRLWRDHDGRRVPRPDAKSTILELHRRGYILGIIANTITETEIPDWMEADGVTPYFKAVVLSSKVAVRKPNPEIYWEAARRVGVEPAKCVYVGDNPVRDVEGTQAAGFGMMILMMEPATLAKEPPNIEVKPDFTIHEMSELLDIFPPREASPDPDAKLVMG